MWRTCQAALVLSLAGAVAGAGAVFAAPEPPAWAEMSARLLAGAAAMTAANFLTLALLGGWRAAARFLVLALLIGWLAEVTGTRCGWLFGGIYHYHPDVRPVLPGGIPVYIPLAWFVVCGLPVMLLRDGPSGGGRSLLNIAAGAGIAAACDLALDPVSVSTGIWAWERPGPYFGVPLGNFAGWWLVAGLILLAGGARGGFRRPAPIRFDLAWGAANGMLLLVLGRVAWQRPGRFLPVGLALLGLLPFLLAWHAGLWRKIQAWRASRSSAGAAASGAAPGT